MNRLIKHGLLMLVSLLVAGCQTVPKTQASQVIEKKPETVVSIPGKSSKPDVHNLTQWNITGAVAIHTSKDNLSASMEWHEHQRNYDITLYGPVGAGRLTLQGGPGHVHLATSDGKQFNASSPEALLRKQMGWTLPVSNLYYWVRGLPVPSLPADTHYDAANHLISLRQQGWQIQYSGYRTIQQYDLPSKIVMNYPSLNVKLVLSRWNF